MRTPHNSLISLLAASVLTGLAGIAAASDAPPEFVLDQWMTRLGVPEAELAVVPLPRRLTAGAEVALPPVGPVGGFGLSGTVALADPGTGLVRVLLVAEDGAEHLVLEAYSLALSADRVAFRNVCEETCVLPGVVPVRLRVEVVDATLETTAIAYHGVVQARTRSRLAEPSSQAQADAGPDAAVRDAQVAARVARLNERIEARGLRWTAGDTPIARLTHAEKQALFGRDEVPNLQGFEYYVGGVFDVSGSAPVRQAQSAQSALPPEFDWRNRHGANDPSSPYFDGDTTGGGWMTSIKRQRCGDCWAFSAIGAVEAQVNLFFNRHVDLDLSEQQMVSCSGAGTCSGGWPGPTLDYVAEEGVVDEACFPETGRDDPCDWMCTNPVEQIKIEGRHDLWWAGVEVLKRHVVENGPIAFGMCSWRHCLVAAGYQRDPADGGTIWVLKNSWGSGWGDHGYGYVRPQDNDICYTHAVRRPVYSLVQSRSIECNDYDGDGYFNWGLDAEPPAGCGGIDASMRDCDDSDPGLGPYGPTGDCRRQDDLIVDPASGHGYRLVHVEEGIDWYDARAAAAATDYDGVTGHLVTLNSRAEEGFLAANYPELEANYVWLGGTDEAAEGQWRWITGERWGYTNWDPGEPNGGATENCLDYSDGVVAWNDEACTRQLQYYLVEYAVPTVRAGQGYTLTIGPDDISRFTLLNTSTAVSISEFEFTIGDQDYFFDYVTSIQVLVDAGPQMNIDVLMPSPNTGGDLLAPEDDLYRLGFEGFGPGDALTFVADVDRDGTNSFENDWRIYFDNGAAANSRVTAEFSSGDELSYVLPDDQPIVGATVTVAQRTVAIDVRPGDDINIVNNRFGMIPVAVLTTSVADGDPLDFNALEVDPASVRLGYGAAGTGISARNAQAKDVDSDGDADLLLRFRARDADILCTDFVISLDGWTYGGENVRGQDSIRPVLCQ